MLILLLSICVVFKCCRRFGGTCYCYHQDQSRVSYRVSGWIYVLTLRDLEFGWRSEENREKTKVYIFLISGSRFKQE
jgi:hypothetical protein